MNVTYNIFSNINGSGIEIVEKFRLSISSIYKSCIVKFHKLVTNWFFIFKIWINTWKQFTECFTGNSPKKLILSSLFMLNSIYKRNTTSESLQQPFKDWCFCIIKRKTNFIGIIRSVFGFIFANAQAAFSINKSSKIGIIVSTWINGITKLFKLFFMMLRNYVSSIFKYLHFINIFKSVGIRITVNKAQHQKSFLFFFNKIFNNIINKNFRFIFFDRKRMQLLMSFNNMFFRTNRSTKHTLEFLKNIVINRRYNNRSWKFISYSSFREKFSYIKTAISIKISRQISIISLFNFIHSINNVTLHAVKSIKVTDMDSPTEVTLYDIQQVVQQLLSNDAKTVLSSVEATNKFGTSPVPNAYMALGHTDLSSNLENINGFLGTFEYGSQKTIDPAEWGTIGRVRFLLSSRGSKSLTASAKGEDVYNTPICGMEAYATVGLENDNAKFIYHDYKLAGGALELNSTGAWKMSHGAAITNDSWICNLKSTLVS